MSRLQKLLDRFRSASRQQDNPLIEIFAEIPTLETERLILRRILPEDAQSMYDYACRSDVTRYLLWDPHPDAAFTARYLQSVQEKYRTGEFYDWAVVLRDSQHMIGTCGFSSVDLSDNRAEVGYVLHPQYWGRGIAAEALDCVLDFAFNVLRFHRIEARYLIGNDRSRRVMEKCGMRPEGIQRQAILQRGVYRDVAGYAILRDEYRIGRAIRLAEKNGAVILPSEQETAST